MSDPGRGHSGPPPQPQEHERQQWQQKQQKQQKKQKQTRWKELQAAFQRPQELLQASQASQARQGAEGLRPRAKDASAAPDDLPAELTIVGSLPSPADLPADLTTQSVAMASPTKGWGDRRSFDQHMLPPSPASPVPQSFPFNAASAEEAAASTAAADPDATPKASASSRPTRARGIFKVSSFLNIRSSNFGQIGGGSGSGSGGGGNNGNGNIFSTKSKKGLDGDSRAPTPLESPMEAPLMSPWLDFSRKVSSRTGSRDSGNEKHKDSRTEYFGLSAPSAPQNLHPSASDASSADTSKGSRELRELRDCTSPGAAPTPTSAAAPHDWRQWDQDYCDGPSFLVNAADFSWHRPSFKQVVESLQVAVVSGETVPPSYQGNYGAAYESGGRRPLASPSVFAGGAISSLSKRRPSMPTPPITTVTTGPDSPIPGRYRSHIMCAIEGIHSIQAALDSSMKRAKEAEESRERDLGQFADLSEEWAQREQQYELEIRKLKDALAAASSPAFPSQPAKHRRMFSSLRSEDSSNHSSAQLGSPIRTVQDNEPDERERATASSDAAAPAQDTFLGRVRAAIESSSRTIKTRPADGEPATAIEKRPAKPALICDLDHDRIMSDRLFWELSLAERNRCRQRRRWADRDLPPRQPAPVSEAVAWVEATAKEKRRRGKNGRKALGETGEEGPGAVEKQNEKGYDKKARRRRRPKTPKAEPSSIVDLDDAAGDPAFDTSPCQSAPSRPLGSLESAQHESKLVRWSTSQPFSPPGSEDGNSDDEEGEEDDDSSSSFEELSDHGGEVGSGLVLPPPPVDGKTVDSTAA